MSTGLSKVLQSASHIRFYSSVNSRIAPSLADKNCTYGVLNSNQGEKPKRMLCSPCSSISAELGGTLPVPYKRAAVRLVKGYSGNFYKVGLTFVD